MSFDVEVPEPPELTNRGAPADFEAVEVEGGAADFRRGELESILRSGAWREAFEEWAQYTDLTATEIEVLADLGLFEAIDVFWDPGEERLRAAAPRLPPDVESLPSAIDEQDRSSFDTALMDLAEVLVELLASEYVDWGGTAVDDYVWSVETFGQAPDGSP